MHGISADKTEKSLRLPDAVPSIQNERQRGRRLRHLLNTAAGLARYARRKWRCGH